MLACLWLYTVNFKRAYLNFVLRKSSSCKPGSAIARVQRRLPGVEMTEVEEHMATYSRRQDAHRQYKFDQGGG